MWNIYTWVPQNFGPWLFTRLEVWALFFFGGGLSWPSTTWRTNKVPIASETRSGTSWNDRPKEQSSWRSQRSVMKKNLRSQNRSKHTLQPRKIPRWWLLKYFLFSPRKLGRWTGWNLKIEVDGSDDFPYRMVLFKGTRSFSGGCSSSIFFLGTFGRFLVGWNFWTPWRERWAAKSLWGNSFQGNLLLVFWLSLRKGEVTCRVGFSHEQWSNPLTFHWILVVS